MASSEVATGTTATPAGPSSDVIVVGAGPVGLVTALLLARRGWQVTMLERWPEPYPMPRAAHFDDEVARLLADAGLAELIPRLTEPADIYEWRNGKGQTLIRFDWSGTGPSGWPRVNMFHQRVMADLVARDDRIRLLRGHEAVLLIESDRQVEVLTRNTLGKQRRFTAFWVIGCDGANSFVRSHMPTEVTDLGFFFDWLIVDVVPHEPREWNPAGLQVCDPARPTTVVPGGPGRRRWEFMRMPGETAEQFNRVDTALGHPRRREPTTGVLHRPTGDDPAPGAGVLTPQGRISYRGRTGRLDEVLGPRFVLGCTENPEAVLDADQRAFLNAIDAAVLHLVSAGDGAGAAADAAVDLDDVYMPHMREAGHVAALIHPDHYLFGTASAMTDLSGLVDDLRRQITAAHPALVATTPIPYTKGRLS